MADSHCTLTGRSALAPPSRSALPTVVRSLDAYIPPAPVERFGLIALSTICAPREKDTRGGEFGAEGPVKSGAGGHWSLFKRRATRFLSSGPEAGVGGWHRAGARAGERQGRRVTIGAVCLGRLLVGRNLTADFERSGA